LKCYFVADRRPVLKGDNLWRGHAAAFVRHARLAPEDILCEGRVLQVIFINVSSIGVFVKLLHCLPHVCLILLELEELIERLGLRLFSPKSKLVDSAQ